MNESVFLRSRSTSACGNLIAEIDVIKSLTLDLNRGNPPGPFSDLSPA
jgi:hypothetical protein